MALIEQRRNVTKNLIENHCLILGQKRGFPILLSFDMSLIRNSHQLKLNEATEYFYVQFFIPLPPFIIILWIISGTTYNLQFHEKVKYLFLTRFLKIKNKTKIQPSNIYIVKFLYFYKVGISIFK